MLICDSKAQSDVMASTRMKLISTRPVTQDKGWRPRAESNHRHAEFQSVVLTPDKQIKIFDPGCRISRRSWGRTDGSAGPY